MQQRQHHGSANVSKCSDGQGANDIFVVCYHAKPALLQITANKCDEMPPSNQQNKRKFKTFHGLSKMQQFLLNAAKMQQTVAKDITFVLLQFTHEACPNNLPSVMHQCSKEAWTSYSNMQKWKPEIPTHFPNQRKPWYTSQKKRKRKPKW